MYFFRQIVLDGGMMSFGPNGASHWRRVPAYVDKILKGERPADLPIEQPTKYEIVVNRKTADALGLVIPPAILAQADEIIE
jgi:putative ABC transport system substrate-binding protein